MNSSFWTDHDKVRNMSWIILLAFIVTNFIASIIISVDIPYADTWDVLGGKNGIDTEPSLSFSTLFTTHNVHLIVIMKAIYIISYYLFDMNNLYINIINYFITISLSLSLYLVVKNYIKDIAFAPLLFVPLFSYYFIDIFTWAFLLSSTLMVTFGFLAIYFGFIKDRNIKNVIIMIIFLILSAMSTSYTFATGVIISYILKEIIYIRSCEKVKKFDIITLITTIILFIITIPIPFYLLRNPEVSLPNLHIAAIIPNFIKSIVLSTTLLSSNNLLLTIPLLIFVSIPVLTFIINKDVLKNKDIQAVYAVIIASLTSIAAVSVFRTLEKSIHTRHYAFALILTPIVAILFIKLHYKYKTKLTRRLAMIYLTAISLIVIGTIPVGVVRYQQIYQTMTTGNECVQEYYKGLNNGMCNMIYPRPLLKHLDRANELGLSFTKD